jgi:hypothetical protein
MSPSVREEFRGVLVPLIWRTMGEKARRGFEAMNAAIKERAERRREEESSHGG